MLFEYPAEKQKGLNMHLDPFLKLARLAGNRTHDPWFVTQPNYSIQLSYSREDKIIT